MPLHIDYRPTKLSDIIGNRATVAAMEGVLSRKSDFPRAILFTGPSGCGKTTLGRIYLNELGIDAADIRELNIADLRGIEHARTIQEQSRLRPMKGERRGWILDEVHMATKEFQNAMLKLLEDTPKHVIFALCTTDPHKLLKTIITRCHEFRVESLSSKEIMTLLCDTIKAEKVDVPTDVLTQIAQDANGSPRAALVTLDKIIDMDPKEMLEAAAKAAEEMNQSIELCRALINGEKWSKVSNIITGMGEFEVESVRQHIIKYCESVLLKNGEGVSRAWLIMDSFRDPLDRNGRPGFVYQAYMAVNTK